MSFRDEADDTIMINIRKNDSENGYVLGLHALWGKN